MADKKTEAPTPWVAPAPTPWVAPAPASTVPTGLVGSQGATGAAPISEEPLYRDPQAPTSLGPKTDDPANSIANKAAEQASQVVDVLAPDDTDTVECVVTKKGDGKISNGIRKGLADGTYARGTTIRVPRATALTLEERGFVEID